MFNCTHRIVLVSVSQLTNLFKAIQYRPIDYNLVECLSLLLYVIMYIYIYICIYKDSHVSTSYIYLYIMCQDQ